MSCTQKQQLVCFPKVRVYKPWFRHFNDHKDFRNEGTVHLFSLMALFSYANFRSNERVINGDRYMEAPGQWICKLGALPRILRVHSKTQALELMEYFQNHGFLTFEILDEEKEILRFTIADWKEHCTHLQYNYYSYKGSGFFFFPLPVGRLLLKTARKEVGIVFSELDAIMDMWLHTILNDPKVRGSEYMPVVYYSNMRGMPLLSYTYLARRWGWSKSRVGRFMLKAGIAHEFREIYACEFFYDEEGLACWPKLDVNFTNKTQFVYRINKGVLDVSDDKTLNDSMPDDSKRIPFTNMIYVGDGLSDVPCMKMMRAYGGQAIAVYQEENRQGVEDLLSKGRVDFIFPADYREGTTLDSTVKNIIRKMAICDTLAEENAAQFRQIGRSPLPYQASLFEET